MPREWKKPILDLEVDGVATLDAILLAHVVHHIASARAFCRRVYQSSMWRKICGGDDINRAYLGCTLSAEMPTVVSLLELRPLFLGSHSTLSHILQSFINSTNN